MFGKGSSSYEVQSRREGRWRIEGAFTDQEAALSCARSRLAEGGVDEIKVVKFRTLAGLAQETVILNKSASGGGVPAPLLDGSAEGAPPCRTLEEFCGFESRAAIGRLLQRFLDARRLTPTELLHSWPHIRRLDEQGALLGAAVHAVARHQAGQHGFATTERVRELRSLTDAVANRARALADRARLSDFDSGDLPATSRRIVAAVGEGAHDSLFLTLLSLHLAHAETLACKLGQVLVMMRDDAEERHWALLDGVAADILGSDTALRTLLGERPDSGAALGALADALHGRPVDSPSFSPVLARLCAPGLGGRVPLSRSVLLDRVRRALAGDRALDRGDAPSEIAAVRRLTARLTGDDGRLLGGGAMAGALDRRARRHRPDAAHGDAVVEGGED